MVNLIVLLKNLYTVKNFENSSLTTKSFQKDFCLTWLNFSFQNFQKHLVLMQFCWSGWWRIRIYRLVLRNSGWKPSTRTKIAYLALFFFFYRFLGWNPHQPQFHHHHQSTKFFFLFHFIFKKNLFFEFTKHKILNMERRDSSFILFLW